MSKSTSVSVSIDWVVFMVSTITIMFLHHTYSTWFTGMLYGATVIVSLLFVVGFFAIVTIICSSSAYRQKILDQYHASSEAYRKKVNRQFVYNVAVTIITSVSATVLMFNALASIAVMLVILQVVVYILRLRIIRRNNVD